MARICHIAGVAGGALGLAVALPVVELHVVRRIPKAAVPGPHPLDATIDGWRTGPPLRCVWLGDSLSSGVGASSAGDSLPHQTARLLAADAGRPVALTVLAVPGATAEDVAAGQLPAARQRIEAGAADLAIVAVGANDVAHLTRPGDFRARYRHIVEGLAGVPVVCVGLPDIGSAALLAQPLRAVAGVVARRVNRWIGAEAARAGAGYVDIATRPPAMARQRVAAFLSADRYHPNGHGYAVWAGLVAAVLAGGTAPLAVAATAD